MSSDILGQEKLCQLSVLFRYWKWNFVGQKCESHLGVKQRTPAAGFGFGFGFTSRLSGVYQCVPVIMPSCEFPGQGKREILARFWDGIFLIRAINIPNNVLLLPFLPAAFSHCSAAPLHLAFSRFGLGFWLWLWFPLRQRLGLHPGQLTPQEKWQAKGNITNTPRIRIRIRNPFAAIFSHLLSVCALLSVFACCVLFFMSYEDFHSISLSFTLLSLFLLLCICSAAPATLAVALWHSQQFYSLPIRPVARSSLPKTPSDDGNKRVLQAFPVC